MSRSLIEDPKSERSERIQMSSRNIDSNNNVYLEIKKAEEEPQPTTARGKKV